MKIQVKAAMCILLLTSLVTGCKKDEEEEAYSYFKYDNTEYRLAKGFIENYGKFGDEPYNLDLTLISSEFTILEADGEVTGLNGTGNALYFALYTSDPAKLSIRDYTYDASGSFAEGTFNIGLIGINFNPSTGGTMYSIEGGKVSVKSNGAEYEITFNCTANGGKTITGTYKGALKYYNYDDKKKNGKVWIR